MSLHHLLAVLFARRRTVFVLTALVVGAVLCSDLVRTRQYLATAAVMLDVHSSDPVALQGTGSSNASASYMGTQIDLIQSERVAERAMTLLKLDSDPTSKNRWQQETGGRGQYEPWMAERLLRSLEVRPSRDSNVIGIGYSAPDPVFAAAAANAFVRAYVDTTLDMKVEPAKQYNAFFDDRARQLRASLEQAQGRLSAYQQAKGIIATDDRLDVENARLSELTTQVVGLQDVAAAASSRNGQAGANSQEVLSNLTIVSLTADLSRAEGLLSELRQRLGDNHPQVVQQTANVAQLRSRLAAETRQVSSSIGVNSGVDRARLASAQSALAEQRAKVLQLRGQRDEASVLVRDVDSAQKAYDAALARLSQTSLESQTTFTNVSIIKTASAPAFASSPRILLDALVALVVGGLLAIAIALMRELADRRLRFDTDVTDSLSQHLLVRLPAHDRTPGEGRLATPAPLTRLFHAPQGSTR